MVSRNPSKYFWLWSENGYRTSFRKSGNASDSRKKHPNGKMQWSTPTPYSIAFGANILVNSMQMLRSYAILANGGYDVHPTLLRKIMRTNRDGTKEIILDNMSAEKVKQDKGFLSQRSFKKWLKR